MFTGCALTLIAHFCTAPQNQLSFCLAQMTKITLVVHTLESRIAPRYGIWVFLGPNPFRIGIE